MPSNFDIMMNPEKYGFKKCEHCHGYGSFIESLEGEDICTVCGGIGVVPNPDKRKEGD